MSQCQVLPEVGIGNISYLGAYVRCRLFGGVHI